MPGRKLLLSKTISLLVMNAKITATVHAIILYTIDKRNYLKSLSDIKDIVNNEPIKKEATKKKVK